MSELNIRQERIKKGWTQEYVGKEVGISKVAIHDIETGKQKPSYGVLIKLLALFNVEHENISRLFAPVEETRTNSNTTEKPDPGDEPEGIAKEARNGVSHAKKAQGIVEVISKASAILNDHMKLTRLALDIGDDGEINDPEFRPVFADLAERVPETVK
jgi:transcriptional regulator with XRE-family HTH domain